VVKNPNKLAREGTNVQKAFLAAMCRLGFVGELQAGLGDLIGFSRDVGDVTGVCAGVVIVTALVHSVPLGAGLPTIQIRPLRWQPIRQNVLLSIRTEIAA